MDEGRAMLTEQPEVLFTYPSPMGDYDKIGRPSLMMMIVLITINSGHGLVSLIEGLCARILYFRCEIIGGLRSHLLLFFFRRKKLLQEKAVSPRSHPAS